MAAPKGNKFAGSRKGIPNKKTEQWEKFSQYMLETGLEKFEQELDKLKGKDYIIAMTNLMEFFKPKLARTEMKHEGEVTVKQVTGMDVK